MSTSVILDDFDKEHVNVYLDQSKAYDLLEKVAKNEYIGTQAFIQEDGYDPTSYSLTNSPSKYVVNHMSTFRLQDIHTVSTGVIARLRSDGISRFGSTVTSLLQDFDYECQTYKQTGAPAYSVKAYRTSFINGTPGGYIASYSGGRYSGLSAAIGNSGYTIAQAVNDYQVAYSEIMKQKNAKAVDDYDEYLKNYDKTYEDYKNRVENASGVWIQAGASAGNGFEIYFDEMNSSVLGLKDIDISTEAGAKGSIDIINRASDRISSMRSDIGAQQNRLEHTIKNENNIVENTQAAESRIRDTDMATEMVNNTKLNILEQAVTSMMAQANQSTQGILSLLQ